ncbi:MAG TPA: Asp-tRNA(Asn)/Glu-tRNA(Gln) amidotransferase subunit GatC [Arcobacter sp.]|nr:Asp-tRNA(Asn)/Glu-tRNA(Gln) amidotransferase subunit GatC [Arcobacter sp.]
MEITNETIDKLAKLSSLEIEEGRKDGLKNEIAEIVNFVENLNEVDVSHVNATFTTIAGGQPMREDIVDSKSELAEHILKHAPKVEDNHFVVPQIIE